MTKSLLKAALLAFFFLCSACNGEQRDYNQPIGGVDVEEYFYGRMAGSLTRIYEFTPKSAPHMQCIYVDAYDAGGLSCFPRRDPEADND